MKLFDFIARVVLWPGSQLCSWLGYNPKSEMGLMRSFLNLLFWLSVGLVLILYFEA